MLKFFKDTALLLLLPTISFGYRVDWQDPENCQGLWGQQEATTISRSDALMIINNVVDLFFTRNFDITLQEKTRCKNNAQTTLKKFETWHNGKIILERNLVVRSTIERCIGLVKEKSLALARALLQSDAFLLDNQKDEIVLEAGRMLAQALDEETMYEHHISGAMLRALKPYTTLSKKVAALVHELVQKTTIITEPSAPPLPCCIDSDHCKDVGVLACGHAICCNCAISWAKALKRERKDFSCPVCYSTISARQLKNQLHNLPASWYEVYQILSM